MPVVGIYLIKPHLPIKKRKNGCSDLKNLFERAGFSLCAALSVHNKKAPDEIFSQYFPMIMEFADDDRNFVKKAINWALRAIGKRNLALNQQTISCPQKLITQSSKSAHWIESDTLRELQLESIQNRLTKRIKK